MVALVRESFDLATAPKCLIYLRLSVDRSGEAESIDRQESWARGVAARNGWDVAEVFTERDRSASRPGTRPSFARVLERVQRGDIAHVLAWRSDRLWRHIQDQQAFMTLAALAGLKSVVTSDEGEVVVGRDDDEFRSSLNALLGGRESKVIARRVELYESALAAQGRPHSGGYRPFGFEPDKVTVRADEASAVAEGYRMLLRGESLYSIARAWNADGLTTVTGRPFRNSDVRKLLLAPRYAGLREHRGEVVGAASWPAVVPRETWAAARAVLSARSTGPRSAPARRHLLAGMLRCPCGAWLQASHKAAEPVYRCKSGLVGPHVTVKAREAHAVALSALWSALGDRDGAQALREAVDAAERAQRPEEDVTRYVRDAEAARARLAEIEAMFADGEVTRGEYARLRARAAARVDDAETRLRSVRVAGGPLPSLDAIRASWDHLTVEEQRSVLRAVFARFEVRPAARPGPFDPRRIVPVLLEG